MDFPSKIVCTRSRVAAFDSHEFRIVANDGGLVVDGKSEIYIDEWDYHEASDSIGGVSWDNGLIVRIDGVTGEVKEPLRTKRRPQLIKICETGSWTQILGRGSQDLNPGCW